MMRVYYPLLNNEQKISKIFGRKFLEKCISDTLSVSEVLDANEYLSEIVYGKVLADLIKNKRIGEIKELHKEVYKKNVLADDYTNDIDISDIGLVMIRPETLGLYEKYLEFLKTKSLAILLDKEININFEQYWILYHHGLLCIDESKYDFPSRTFNYIENPCRLLVVTSDNSKISVPNVTNYLMSFKGKHGKLTPGTLRGDIAYNGLFSFVDGNHTLMQEANIALDPIGAYRIITRNLVEYDRAHEAADIPLLFYCGQAIHIPDSDEIKRDLSTLCTSDDIMKIKEKRLSLKRFGL